MLGFFLDGEILGESDLFLVILLGDHDALQVLGVDHPAVDLELTEGVVDLVGGELLTPGHQRVPEPVERKKHQHVAEYLESKSKFWMSYKSNREVYMGGQGMSWQTNPKTLFDSILHHTCWKLATLPFTKLHQKHEMVSRFLTVHKVRWSPDEEIADIS